MTQHKEEWGEDEEGNPEIINEGGDDDDSGEESENEDEVDIGKNRKDVGKVSLSEEKGESLTEKVCEEMEEKGESLTEKMCEGMEGKRRREEGECVF
eukprot:4768419-Ditylum_brightwellii.AAC.1